MLRVARGREVPVGWGGVRPDGPVGWDRAVRSAQAGGAVRCGQPFAAAYRSCAAFTSSMYCVDPFASISAT